METRPLKIGITCFPLIGGSGILATALGMELAARGHEVHFFSHAKPVRLDLSQARVHFHQVTVGQALHPVRRDPRVARRRDHLGGLGAAQQRADERVLAPTAAHHQHSRGHGYRAAMKSSTGMAVSVS